MVSWIIYLFVVIGAVYLLVHYVGERTQVRGDSMYPTLSDGDNLIVDKLTYRFFRPEKIRYYRIFRFSIRKIRSISKG